jgi:Sulfotransferase family
MGEFAVDVGARFHIGCLRGDRSQLSALGVDSDIFFKTFGDGINSLILGHRDQQEAMSRACGLQHPEQINPDFCLSRSGDDPKSRWVDGTPEYSFYICGLRKLFPKAKFVHIMRDVDAVVKSMMNFNMDGRMGLVDSEQKAYEYWSGTVQACLLAERALGPGVVHRLRYDDLVKQPEASMSSLLKFLGEPYDPACVEPLSRRINSSEVPANYCTTDPATDQSVVERARHLSEQLQAATACKQASTGDLAEFEARFEERVRFVASLNDEYAQGQKKVATLTTRLNWCGLMFAVSFALANATYWMNARGSRHAAVVTVVLWWLSATFALAIYLRFRWAGLADLGMRLMRRFNVLKRWQKKSSSPGAEVQGTEHLRRNRGVETSR